MRKKIIASILFLIVFITSTVAYAAIDAKLEINSSSETVKPGDEVTFTIKVKDIVSENGANGIEGTISYDTDKFEELKAENITKAGSWDVAYYNGKVIAEGLTALNNDSDVINIKLKVKEDSSLAGKTASISLNNAVVYNTDKVDLGTVSASVKIEGDTTENPDEENQNTPTPTPTTTITPTAKPDGGSESTPTPSTKPNTTGAPTATTKPNNGVDNGNIPVTNINTNTSSGSSSSSSSSSSGSTAGSTTSSSSLPKAGIGSTIAVLTVVAAIIGTIAYIKLGKYREI